MLNKLKHFIKTQTFRIFLIFLAISFAANVGYLNQSYISDNYGGRVDTFDQMSFGEFFNSAIITTQGRHMSITYWLIHAPLSKIGINYYQNQWVFFAIEIILMAVASTLFYTIFSKALKYKKISLPLLLATSFIAVNPFITDSLVFLLPSHPQALLLVALSLWFFTKKPTPKSTLLSLLFLTLAVSTYQNYYALFIILVIPLLIILNKGKIDKALLKRVGVALLITAISIAFVLIISKAHNAIVGIENSKGTSLHLSISWLLERAIFLFKTYVKSALTTFYLFPPLLLVAIIAAIMIAIGVHLIREHKIKEYAFIVIATGICFFSPIYYGMIAETFYIAPRIMPAIFASLSICIVLLLFYFPKLQKNNYIIGGTMVITAIITYCCSTFTTDLHIANRVELAELRLIASRIEQYEADSGITVTTIAPAHFKGGSRAEFYRQNIHDIAAVNASRDLAMTEWSDAGAIVTLTKRKFERRDMTKEEYDKYFGDLEIEDYQHFDPDVRLKFVGDTLYWAEY